MPDASVFSPKRHAVLGLCWQTGASLLLFPLFVVGFATLSLMCGSTLSRPLALLLLIAGAALALVISQQLFRQDWRLSLALPVGSALVALVISLSIYDTSIDGQHYHFQAIYALSHGWNPFWSTGAPPAIGDPAAIWVTHYPMAAWLFGAVLASAGLPLESTKWINFLALLSSALILVGALGRLDLPRGRIAILAAIAVLNPIVISQLFTRMNDGVLAACLLIFVVCAAVWVAVDDRKAFVIAATSMIFALNIKFSAVPIFGLLCAATVVAHLLVHGRRAAFANSLQLLAAGIVGVVILGWAPYVLNLWRFGHPFYPLMGHGAVDIMAGNTPPVLLDLSRPARFLFSLFADTHAGYETMPALKLPLAFSWAEIRAAGGTDVRIGGFGPLFAAVVLLAMSVVALQIARRQLPMQARWLLFVGAAVFLSVLAMPENWWARYVPQFWLVPWIVAMGALSARARWLQAMGWALAILMLVDASIVAAASTAQAARRSMAVSAQIATLKRAPGPYCVAAELAQSRIAVLQAAGIDARSVAQSAASRCAEPAAIVSYGPDRFGGRICSCATGLR